MTDAGDTDDQPWPAPNPGPVPPGGWAPPQPSGTPPEPPQPAAPTPAAPQAGYSPPTYLAPPPAYGAPPSPSAGFGYSVPGGQAPRTEPMAIASMVCGIAAIPLLIMCVGFVLGILGIVFGFVARGRIARSVGTLTGGGMALAGIICGAVAEVLFAAWIALVFVAG